MKNTFALVAGKAVLEGSLVLDLLLSGHANAHAAPIGVDAYAYESEVYLYNMYDDDGDALLSVDGLEYPVCHMEDGSDLPADQLPCVWTSPNSGDSWLTYEDRSFL